MVSCLMGDSTALASAIVRCCPRNGGQIALRGYSYQFLYSCYLILSSSSPGISFQLEGIEDIDCIKQKNDSSDVTHIQLKYSVNKQDASFLPDVLKNFLEAYCLFAHLVL